MNWRDYENAVFEILRSRFAAEQVQANLLIPGKYSEIERQIDVAGRSMLMGHQMLAIVDCKCYSRTVDVKDVEAVIGMAADVSADIALIVTTVGYSEAARSRAHNEPNVRTHLDIITPDEAARNGDAPASAVMYRGRIGAVVLAPSGWLATSNIVGGHRVIPEDALCYLHASDQTVEAAFDEKSIGWCNIEDNPDELPGQMDTILQNQKAQALAFDSESEIEVWNETVGKFQATGMFRRIYYKSADYVDFTFFGDMGGPGVFWACMISKPEDEHHALNRLRFLANSVILAFAPSADPSNSHGVWQNFFPWRPESDK